MCEQTYTMDENKYLIERVEDQIKYYNDKSGNTHKWYIILRTAEIIISASIPFLAGLSTTGITIIKSMNVNFLLGILGVIVAAIAGILNLFKFQENWVQYRKTSEALKHEKFLFLTRSGLYSADNRFTIFTERFEDIILKENSHWSEYIKLEKAVKQKEVAQPNEIGENSQKKLAAQE